MVTLKLLRYTMWMLLMPLATFYLFYYVIFARDEKTLAMCGLLAVLAANLVVASYIIMAWKEEGTAVKATIRLESKEL